jgi:hypothetical protein
MTAARSVLFLMLLSAALPLAGCAWTARGLSAPEKPSPQDLLATFNDTALGKSTSGDALAAVRYPEFQLVVNGQNGLAVSGPRTAGSRTWLTLFSFGDSLTVSGKYFFLINDKPTAFMYKKFIRARLDAEKIITPEVLAKNYSDEEARNVAILSDILTGFGAAAKEVKVSDTRTRSCAMAVHDLLSQILAKLAASPSEAMHFDNPAGIAFDHATMGPGRFRMIVEGDVVKLKVIVGSVSEDMASLPDVKNM